LLTIGLVSASSGFSDVVVTDTDVFVDRLASFIRKDRTRPLPDWNESDAAAFTSGCFSCILHASIQDQRAWDKCKRTVDFHQLFGALLLSENRFLVRKAVSDVVLGLCNSPPGAKSASRDESLAQSTHEILETLWVGIVSVIPSIPNSSDWRMNSEAFFGVASALMRSVARGPSLNAYLPTYIETWVNTLLPYVPFQVGNSSP